MKAGRSRGRLGGALDSGRGGLGPQDRIDALQKAQGLEGLDQIACRALFDRLSRSGFAVNFLSDRVNFKSDANHHSAPEGILTLALQHSPRVSLRHDYMPFEFTVFVDKRSAVEPDLNVFLPFAGDCKP